MTEKLNVQQKLEKFYISHLPYYAACTDDFRHGLIHTYRKYALNYKSIEHNAQNSKAWIVLDMDEPYYYEDAVGLPLPNMVVYNKTNIKKDFDTSPGTVGLLRRWRAEEIVYAEPMRSHLFFALKTPVHIGENARPKPIEYLRNVEYGLTKAFGADLRYTKYTSKNPFHNAFKTQYLHDYLWELSDFEEWIDIPNFIPYDKVKKAEGGDASLGRNCELFEAARHWAYRQNIVNECSFREKLLEFCYAYDKKYFYSYPLPDEEIETIADSITRFCIRNELNLRGFKGEIDSEEYQEYIELQRKRGKANTSEQQAEKRKGKYKLGPRQVEGVIRLWEAKVKIKDIAKKFRVSPNTISSILKRYFEEMPEDEEIVI